LSTGTQSALKGGEKVYTMSATIIPFPSKVAAPTTSYCCDIEPAAKGGFAYVDACVPAELAFKFMALFVHCEDRAGMSLDMTQPESRGMMLIDACIPSTVAEEFRAIVAAAA
jgi:hypothetical protein